MGQIEAKEKELASTNNISEKTRLQNEINETKGKIADEVNTKLTVEFSAFPKAVAQIEMRNPNFWPFNKK